MYWKEGAAVVLPSVSLKNTLANSVAPPLLKVRVNLVQLPTGSNDCGCVSVLDARLMESDLTLCDVLSCDVVSTEYWLVNLVGEGIKTP